MFFITKTKFEFVDQRKPVIGDEAVVIDVCASPNREGVVQAKGLVKHAFFIEPGRFCRVKRPVRIG